LDAKLIDGFDDGLLLVALSRILIAVIFVSLGLLAALSCEVRVYIEAVIIFLFHFLYMEWQDLKQMLGQGSCCIFLGMFSLYLI
jgi:NADH:ubiquinone oxidoreductase subunit 6 (subunit J)